MSEQGRSPVYESGQWRVDLGRRELLARGVAVPIGARAFEIVEVLVRSANELVTKNDLMDRVWPGAMVGENTLQVHISAIRKAFGPDRAILKTASGRGYRLLGNWTPRQQEAASQPVASPPMSEPSAPPANSFPLTPGRLIGRAAAAQHVRDLASAYRVVTLTGPGGIGKTSLAIEAARGVVANFAGGGWFVELASLSNPDLVPTAAASALGLKLSGEISADAVARAVGATHLLLVLDNCEHVIDAVANLAERVLHLCPHTTVLATSREVLRIDGEAVYRVPPLDVPALEQATPEHILGHSAVELFIARMHALDVGFSPRAENLASIAAICRRLDGIPLAIEFAAASAATLGIESVAMGLRDRFSLLTRGQRTALARQRTLRATLDWSHELLPEVEQQLFRRLAVFQGGFTLDAAAAVITDTRLDAAMVTNGVANLVSKSLVALDTTRGATRWRLLETVRAYALGKLVEIGELDAVAQRHARYCLEFIQAAEADAETRPTDAGLSNCAARIDDIHAALDWCFAPGGSQALGVELTVAAVPVWMEMSLVLECRTRVQRALAVSPAGAGNAAQLRMKLLGALAGTLLGGVAEALDVNQVWATVFDVAEELGSIDYQLRALLGMCRDHYKESKLDEALILSEKFCAIAEHSTNPVDRLIGQRMMGYTLHFRGEQAKARQHIETMLNGYDDVAHGSYVMRYWFDRRVTALTRLAQILWLQGFPDQAASIVDRSLHDALAGGHGPSLCSMLAQGPCPIAIANGDLEKANDVVRLLLELSAKYELRGWSIWGHGFESLVMIRRGAVAEGCEKLRAQVERAPQADTPLPFTGFVAELALAHAKLGEYQRALGLIDATLARCARDRELWIYPELLRSKGEIILAHGGEAATATAEQLFVAALAYAEQQKVLSWSLRAATSLGHLRRSQGRTQDAREPLASIYARFSEGFATADLRAARRLLDALA